MKKAALITLIMAVLIPVLSAPAQQAAPAKERTKEEMIERLNRMVETHPDLVSVIQGLAVTELEGKKIVTYKGKALEDLDKEEVRKIYVPASRYVTVKNVERIDKQLKSMQQIENMNRMQRTVGQPVPSLPKIPASPPAVPKTPATQTLPRVPSTPRK